MAEKLLRGLLQCPLHLTIIVVVINISFQNEHDTRTITDKILYVVLWPHIGFKSIFFKERRQTKNLQLKSQSLDNLTFFACSSDFEVSKLIYTGIVSIGVSLYYSPKTIFIVIESMA